MVSTTDHEELEERLLIDAAMEESVSSSVAPTAFLMMFGYIVLTVSHLFVLPFPESAMMATIAGVTCAACAFAWRQGNASLANYVSSHQVIAVLSLLILINVSVHMWLLKDHLQTTQFALVMVACGFLMLHSVWFAVTILTYLGTWTVLNWLLPSSPNSVHFGYLMTVSTLMAVAAHIARRQTTVHTETARIRSEREQKRMQEEARKQQEHLKHVSRLLTLGELVAGIAHELNQPLSAISNLATACELMVAQEESTDLRTKQGSALQEISGAAVRAGSIIKRLRGLATKSSRTRSEVDLNQVVRDAADLLSSDSRRSKGELRLELDPGLATVQADEVQMQQVVLNLLQNGFDALEEPNGEVVVTTSMSSAAAQVSIADTGSGVPSENPNSVFDAFFTTKDHGMGMGLAICRSILESHGGKISCTRREPDGNGSTFDFSLPLSPKLNEQSDRLHH